MNDNIDWHNLLQRLAEPFDASEIKYRAGATNRDKTKAIALAYADPRAYEDRLNLLVPGEWHVQFTPWGEHRLICHLTILDVTRSSTGESGDSNPDIAGTSAEAQAFKRACTKFGLGRYLYSLPTQWVDYDANTKQLKGSPTLAAPQRAPQSRELVSDAIGPKRAALMQKELAKLGVARRDQLAYATSVLGREVPDLAALEEREARIVWSAARELQDPRAA
ncbi:MAG: hypothetical protein ROY82_01840 [Truepera sp.]|jgi:hypothetical protein|nr:hypothetical protein [Truepera sp.]